MCDRACDFQPRRVAGTRSCPLTSSKRERYDDSHGLASSRCGLDGSQGMRATFMVTRAGGAELLRHKTACYPRQPFVLRSPSRQRRHISSKHRLLPRATVRTCRMFAGYRTRAALKKLSQLTGSLGHHGVTATPVEHIVKAHLRKLPMRTWDLGTIAGSVSAWCCASQDREEAKAYYSCLSEG
ncbi:hypothetical protein K466DRAFT_277741 [Polyporus arcularius HHB13444]|uniref:Uncharacterized protein n=1 Tax=Polyporus arcularius HHB13444 TaxID=1314778 RepID=A0A5C3NZX6_9APHY|nr:hypothetical protein K466DRAFT_277741 [Polyporus arcularius HHB13444]